MKFTMKVTDGSMTWTEEYDKSDITDAQKWAEETIFRFNHTIRKGEKTRKLISVQVHDKDTDPDHLWRKQNLITKKRGKLTWDEYKCEKCGVTAKRYGISEYFHRNPKYAAEVFARCDTSRKHQEQKRRARA